MTPIARRPSAAPPVSARRCRPPPRSVDFNSECGVGARCRNGACERPCATILECGTGDTCLGGFCQPDPVGGGRCVLNARMQRRHLRQRLLPRRLQGRQGLRRPRSLRRRAVPGRRRPRPRVQLEYRLRRRRPHVRERRVPHGLRDQRRLLRVRRRQHLPRRLLRDRRRGGAHVPARRDRVRVRRQSCIDATCVQVHAAT